MGSRKFSQSRFLDRLRLYVRGGGGGQGLARFGGHGGRGGHIYLVADESYTLHKVLREYKSKRVIAGNGHNSSKDMLLGEYGEDKLVRVPPGVVAVTDKGHIIGELNEEGEKLLAAQGGKGGGPDNRWQGQKGEAHAINLDLKLIADVGLVGFPNAGKSTLLSAISRASPKVAAYPFTTIKPNVGIIQYDDTRQIKMADLPGLIEGAHINVGLGHHFLKHVERTKILLFMVDMNGFQLSPRHPFRNAAETVLLLNKELELYKPELIEKPALLIVNKIDTASSPCLVEDVLQQVKSLPEIAESVDEEVRPKSLVKFAEILSISAKKRTNTEHLKERIRKLLDFYMDIQLEADRKLIEKREKFKEDVQERLTERRFPRYLT